MANTLLFAADNSEVTFALPAACDLTGAFTMAMLFRLSNTVGFHALVNHNTPGNTDLPAPDLEMSGSNLALDTAGATALDSTLLSNGSWYIAAVTKPSGTVVPTFHTDNLSLGIPGGVWNHTAGSSAVANAPSCAGGAIHIGQRDGGDDLWANVAVVAAWKDIALSSAQIQELGANLKTSDWVNNSGGPPCYLFELTSQTDIPDVMGNGAALIGVTGTTLDALVPVGWTFDAGPPPTPPQTMRPDGDLATTGWSTAPLFSKLNDQSDATVITAPLS